MDKKERGGRGGEKRECERDRERGQKDINLDAHNDMHVHILSCLTALKHTSKGTKYLHIIIITPQNKQNIQYTQKYWQELNLVVEPKITIARILAI